MRLTSSTALAAVVAALFPLGFLFRLPDARLKLAFLFLVVSASLLAKTMRLPSLAALAARLAPAAVVRKPAQAKSVAFRHAKWSQPDRGAAGDPTGADATDDACMQGPVTMHPITMEFSSTVRCALDSARGGEGGGREGG
jgi:hypothetical protein